jgi:hypothetical protein
MKSRDVPRRVREQISVQEVGAETLAYDERRHRAFCLNRSCSAVWRLATGEHSVAQMSRLASIELGEEMGEEFVRFAVEELRREGLIEPVGAAEAGMPLSRRDMLQRLGVGGAMLLPAVAAIVAPTAAQAYSGCFDCSDSDPVRAKQLARASQVARMRSQQQNTSVLGAANDQGVFSLYAQPEDGPPDDDPSR